MVELKVIGSGSRGNAYMIKCSNESILIECGLSFNEILKGVDYDVADCVACVVSHR